MPNDLSTRQATRRVAALRMGGGQIPPAEFGQAEIVVTGNCVTSTGMGAVYPGTLQLRPRTKPTELAMPFGRGHAEGVSKVGVDALDGDTWTLCVAAQAQSALDDSARIPRMVDDELEICMAAPEQARPSDFSCRAGHPVVQGGDGRNARAVLSQPRLSTGP